MTSPQRPSVLELWLVVRGARSPSREVAVEADPACTVGQLADALASHLELGGAQHAFCIRTGDWLDATQPIGSSGLRQGDSLVLSRSGETRDLDSDATRQLRIEIAELEIVGGPMSGSTYGLTAGEHVLGRDPACEVVIEDPSLSRQHARIMLTTDAVSVSDLGSTNGTVVGGEALAAGVERGLAVNDVVTTGRTLFAVRPRRRQPSKLDADGTGSVPFNRPPRVEPPRRPVEIELAPPPDEPQRVTLPLAASLAPAAVGVLLFLVTKQPTMLIVSALSPIMAAWTFLEDRRRGGRGFKRKSLEFRAALQEVGVRLAQAADEEADRRRRAAPPATELLERARGPLPTLWERRPEDADFLHLRVGSGDQPSGIELKLDKRGSESLRKEADAVAGRSAILSAVPVLVPVPDAGVVGLSGSAERIEALARFLIAQAVALHSPRDLVICAAVADEGEWSWLKWLPHARSDSSPLACPHLAAGKIGARRLVEALQELLNDRREEERNQVGSVGSFRQPFILVLLDESIAPERSLLSDLLADRGAHGIAVLWLGSKRQALPLECGAVIELDPEVAKLTLTDVASGEASTNVTADGLPVRLASELSLGLAPLRDIGAARGRGQIPRRVSLVELLGTDEVSPKWLAARWEGDRSHRTAPLGATDSEPFELDLRRDGPHALIAGTTGSGKSELLQSAVASLACTHRPDRVTFLLVDYKGGAAFKECTALPHTVGFVTDLDGHLTHRALLSLNAELRRREELLNRAGAKDLVEMEKRDPEGAPPSLVIVIDEFATLAKEVPDFVQGVVDVAQRGRSLGVHLVLATQRPGGVVTDNIRANTNLRIALRVSDAGESSDVIGSPEAARIPRDVPGRAFARTGHSELTEFQAAYVGSTTSSRAAAEHIVVHDLGLEGPRILPSGAGASLSRSTETDLERIVRVAAETAAKLQIPDQPSPWLPPLPELVVLADLERSGEAEDADDATAVAGLIDEPTLQRQRVCLLDLEADGNILVFGTSGSGKTALLRTLASSLAMHAPPSLLHLYCLDFASRGLTPFESLPHCGSVIPGEDEERVERLFSLLRKELARRKEAFARTGASSLREYRKATGSEEPRFVVLLDGYAAFSAAFERVNQGELIDALPRLVAEGRPLGVHFLITADRRGAVPGSLTGIVQRKIVLRMADEDEYAALGVDLRLARGARLPPGRGFIDNRLELQCCLVGGDVSGEGQAGSLTQLGEALSARYGSARAPAIGILPAHVPADSLPAPAGPLEAVVGIGDDDLDPVTVGFAEGHFLVAGPYRSGRTTALATIVRSLRAHDPGLELHLLAPRRSSLVELDVWQTTASGIDRCDASAAALVEKLHTSDVPVVIVVDDGTELFETAGAPALEQIVRRGRDANVRVVAAAEIQAAHRAFGGWLRELRKEENGLLLSPQVDLDGELFGVRLPRRSDPVFPPGRGYLVRRGAVELVQVATA